MILPRSASESSPPFPEYPRTPARRAWHRPLEVTLSTNPSETTPAPDPSHPGLGRLGADWAAVIVAAVLVLLAVTGLLPSIPFLVR